MGEKHSPKNSSAPTEDQWAVVSVKLDLILKNQGTQMTDLTALKAVADRLQASDTAALATLQVLKDQNTTLAAKLAAIQTGDPDTQASIDAIVTELSGTADTVDAAVAANPATPNLAPTPAVADVTQDKPA